MNLQHSEAFTDPAKRVAEINFREAPREFWITGLGMVVILETFAGHEQTN